MVSRPRSLFLGLRSLTRGPRSLTRGPRSLGHGLQVACCTVQVPNYKVKSQLLVSGSKMLQFTGQSKETCNRLLVAGLSPEALRSRVKGCCHRLQLPKTCYWSQGSQIARLRLLMTVFRFQVIVLRKKSLPTSRLGTGISLTFFTV
jgi:hypothetical protein